MTDITIEIPHAVAEAVLTISVSDGDTAFGRRVVHAGALTAGLTVIARAHVPLVAREMASVHERLNAECSITLEDKSSGEVLAMLTESVDLQPRDLWLWEGDPHRAEQRRRMEARQRYVESSLEAGADAPAAASWVDELKTLSAALAADRALSAQLSRSLLASFVRPNHPVVSQVAREAAEILGERTGDSRFYAFQASDPAVASARVEATVDAVYEALTRRRIAYSEPPPGWDYFREGQRIREHGEVANGGLGTCMDTTVLFGAVLEHVGIPPALVLMHGHILIGYWRQDPFPEGRPHPDWHPNTAIIEDAHTVAAKLNGGWLGIIETTALTSGSASPATDARAAARGRVRDGFLSGPVRVIDVAVARQEGVSPLPAVREREDGVTEVIEYRGMAAPPRVEEVARDRAEPHRLSVDSHPARYRTWKASLFSMGATNALLNLGTNARVQPLVVPPDALGLLEDRLHQDDTFTLLSGYEIPDVWRARDRVNAAQMLEDEQDRDELTSQLQARRLFAQRAGRVRGEIKALPPATFYREVRSMAHQAKVAREERGMNPLFLCIGLLRWQYKPDAWADAPLILVPVAIKAPRGRNLLTLSLDASQHTAPNAALIEWLRREHNLVIPGLVEPLADRAGIDVDQVLKDVRIAIAERGLPFQVAAEARLATLDLSAFRMWQDLNLHAERFLSRPLVHHLTHSPADEFTDPVLQSLSEVELGPGVEELDLLETPIESDAAQRRAVRWARQGRTFVLQGPPGTGKTQTITNMVAECLGHGQRVLFVAEKGTALSEVQKRLEEIGLSPFSLNLHHESSNVTEVRGQLRRSLDVKVDPDVLAVASARRRLHAARHDLVEYADRLHEANAAALSAYGARDQLLVLGDGPVVDVAPDLVAHHPGEVAVVTEVFASLQRWASAAGVRPNHPWRLAGGIPADSFDEPTVAAAIRGVLEGVAWAGNVQGPVGEALAAAKHPHHLRALADAAALRLPVGPDLGEVLDQRWISSAQATIAKWESRATEIASTELHGFAPEVLALDLQSVAERLAEATASGYLGRRKRQLAALAPLEPFAIAADAIDRARTGTVLPALVGAKQFAAAARAAVAGTPGLGQVPPVNALQPGAFLGSQRRLGELIEGSKRLRESDWAVRISDLARTHAIDSHAGALQMFASAWERLCEALRVHDEDLEAWRAGRSLVETIQVVGAEWTRQLENERLLPLHRWCMLVSRLEPTRTAGMLTARADILEGRLTAWAAADALSRGVATASLHERLRSTGLDRFDALAHEERVEAYVTADTALRQLWRTSGPGTMRQARATHAGHGTGGLARELEKTSRRLSTRAMLKKFGDVIQELTPLILASPSSVVDLIDPQVMDFDLVIFDEASQITVPEAIGSVGRAAAAIIVGDRHQMPPTRRVGSQRQSDEDLDDAEELEIVEDQESILSEADLARVPSMTLTWHYRSQDESLIDFSNRTYYRGGLSSFPTPTLHSRETGVELRRVDQGHYLRAGATAVEVDGVIAGANTNPVEAQAIVREVHLLAARDGELPSVGIVTFNEQQRELIETLLAQSGDDRVLAMQDLGVMTSKRVLFVKALEQVQGDERDIILFSVAFSGQGPKGMVPTNFGPLSNQGGERRLNVAITRAKRKTALFCSFDLHQLDVTGSMYEGPKDLKAFLEFAYEQTHRRVDEGALSEPDSRRSVLYRDRHRDDIAAALEAAGLHVATDVGMSAFRVDLVLSRPEAPHRPILPVFLDGEGWRRRTTTFDRDVLPVSVMQNLMGWPVVSRIWWPMWLQNRSHVIERVLADVERAESAMGEVGEEERQAETSLDAASGLADRSSGAASSPVVSERLASHDGEEPVETSHLPRPAPVGLDDRIPDAEPADPMTARPAGPAEASEVFAPASQDLVGDRALLDALGTRDGDRAVREQVLDVIEAEGPVELQRLARIVGRRFGLTTVRASRVASILRLVPPRQVKKDRVLGDFAWPRGVAPDGYGAFRPSRMDAERAIHEIAPEELANAMRSILCDAPTPPPVDDALRQVAQLFGFSKLGAQVRSRLSEVWSRLGPFSDSGQAPAIDAPTIKEGQLALIAALVEKFEESMRDDKPGLVDLRGPYVQWLGSQRGLVFEASDGGDHGTPVDPVLVEALAAEGWRRPTPERRNCWFVFAAMPDEPPHRRGARLEACAELVEAAIRRITSADSD